MKVLPVFFCTLPLLLWAGCSDNALISKPVDNIDPTHAAVQTNLLLNPGFESTGSWVKWNCANAHQIDYPHSGDYSATLGPGACSLQQTVKGLKPNTTYTLSGWGLVGAITDVYDFVYIGVKNYGGAETKVQFPYIRHWAQQSLTFKTGASNTSAIVYFYKSGGAATSYFDDMILIK